MTSSLSLYHDTCFHRACLSTLPAATCSRPVAPPPVASEDLFRAIEEAFAHHRTLRDLTDKLHSVRARVGRLTPREREVFELVIRGNINKQVARALGCTERTIKAHRHRVMEKMQVKSLAELVSVAERIGIRSATRQTN